ncbi:unnamed protein product [Hymenolepis diminuta]|uniref:Uncharacterized protein n=1 Tax=Hymenolepis diminuta TaxID=6216 RepID=A0A564YH89_HYMDI|nr:unnamed protein product [Hymenolepis diminuta]
MDQICKCAKHAVVKELEASYASNLARQYENTCHHADQLGLTVDNEKLKHIRSQIKTCVSASPYWAQDIIIAKQKTGKTDRKDLEDNYEVYNRHILMFIYSKM